MFLMTQKLTAIIESDGNVYISLCPGLDIASQGGRVEEARRNLEEALELFFETASSHEVRKRFYGEVMNRRRLRRAARRKKE
jgi:predicted RNase H-like HicB family nuclease